ncbi:MAG TPA: endonuclease III [Caldilineaceae bacterium]|nr:endonuclease III [Caldilineaceae bacterium]
MDLKSKAAAIYQALASFYGEPQWQQGDDPVDTLIGTILSANTNDINSGRAFDELRTRFGGDWNAVRTAPLSIIKEAIRPAGMYNQKAPHLIATLEKLWQERGDYSLDFLAILPAEQALAYLTSFPGVGHKTASIVLLFCFNGAAFPVDTHVQRISQRLGICRRRASPEQIKSIWETLQPPEHYYSLHLNLIRHGREICQARTPRCSRCPLLAWCDYANRQGEWSLPAENPAA